MLKNKNIFLIIFCLVAFDAAVWIQVIGWPLSSLQSEIFFLEVGQGDSELVVLPGGAKILIDGGPNSRVLSALDSVLSPSDRYIDLAVLSHPETDHFGGMFDVVNRYGVGAFLWGGQKAPANGFGDLINALDKKKIKMLILGEGDKIKYRDSIFEVVSPPKNLEGGTMNDSSLALELVTGGASALFAGDIGLAGENGILSRHKMDIDILKVNHHGSKTSSGEEFLKKITPEIAVIEVGKNSYGHPTKEVLDRLASIGARVFRTDNDGTIKLEIASGTISVFK